MKIGGQLKKIIIEGSSNSIMYIIYCAFSKRRLVYDTLYSIITIFHKVRLDPRIKIVIYTDQSDLFNKIFLKYKFKFEYQIILENIDLTHFNQFSDYKDVYKIKLYVIKKFFEKYKGNLLFFDSDMYITHDFMSLFNYIKRKEFVLYHTDFSFFEYFISKFGSYDDLIMSNGMIYSPKSKYNIPYHYQAYQSGVIGMNYIYKDIINEVIDFYNDFYNCYSIRNSEELSFAYVFQKTNKVNVASYLISNYSHNDFIRCLIAYFLNIFFDNDEYIFSEILSYYNLSVADINQMNLIYEEIDYIFILLKRIQLGMDLKYENVLLEIISNRTFLNTALERQRVYNLIDKFKVIKNKFVILQN